MQKYMYITPYTFKQTLYRHRNKQGLEEDRIKKL